MLQEELAKHWNVPLQEVKRISNFINSLYSVEIVPRKQNNHDSWQVVIFAYDPKNKYRSQEGEIFNDKDQAIVQGTLWAQNIKISSGQAQNMGKNIPEDIYLALKPIDGFEKAKKRLRVKESQSKTMYLICAHSLKKNIFKKQKQY